MADGEVDVVPVPVLLLDEAELPLVWLVADVEPVPEEAELPFVLSMVSSMADLPDCITLEPVCFVLLTALSTLGWSQSSSHSTSQTNAASTSTDTMNQMILPMIETRFCSYITLCLSNLCIYDSR